LIIDIFKTKLFNIPPIVSTDDFGRAIALSLESENGGFLGEFWVDKLDFLWFFLLERGLVFNFLYTFQITVEHGQIPPAGLDFWFC